jgi:predicted RNA-binding Zn-ribbon protein involved in translation (DUF1610 family)
MRALRWFRAQFATKCPACGEDILAGDWACYDRDKNILCKPCGEEDEE